MAESGSNPAAGLQLPPGAIQAELAAFLAARSASRAAHVAGSTAATAAAAAGGGGGPAAEMQVLPPGCPAAASAVHTILIPWLKAQQQELASQQQRHCSGHRHCAAEAATRVEAAALAAAALAPDLITGVFSRQNQLPEPGLKPVSKLDQSATPGWPGLCSVFSECTPAASLLSLGGCSHDSPFTCICTS